MQIAIISSSTRIGRTSHRVAIAIHNALSKQDIKSDTIDLLEFNLPIFKERYHLLDDKTEKQIQVAEKLQNSNAIIFVTPEYNGGISGSLKVFIDFFSKHEFANKPIGVATVSTGALGGIRAAYQLQQTILAIQAYPQPQILLTGDVLTQLDENGIILNPLYQNKIDAFLNALIKFTSRFKD